jgi:L-Ala-D/L-Glu epimerase
MKITKIECIPVNIPRKKEKLGRDEVRVTDNVVVVKVHTDEGIIGIGESGLPCARRGDTMGSVMGAITSVFGPKILIGEDPFNIEKIVAKMGSLVKGNMQAKTAIDFALYDIVGKATGVPLYKLLGGLSREKVPCVFMGRNQPSPEKVAEESAKAIEFGYSGVKYHCARGKTVDEDLEYLKAIREAIGPDAKLFACGNEGWHYFQALEALKKMEPLNLCHFEQPVPWWDFDSLARLRHKQSIPIWSDESAQELSQVLQLIQMDAVDGMFFKVTCVGGILNSLKWVSICQAAGLPVNLGSMGGTAITAAAQIHFLAAVEWMGRSTLHGNVSFLALHNVQDTVSKPIEDDLVINVPRYEKGYMYPPEGPGLGVELNEELLSKWTSKSMSSVVIGKK